jgi:hypothetical protein
MNFKANESPESGNKKTKLPVLNFSLPELSYESVAHFSNEQGQQFSIRISGPNKTAVEQYTRELCNKFNILIAQTKELETRLEQESIEDIEIPKDLLSKNSNRSNLPEVLPSGDLPVNKQVKYKFPSTQEIKITISIQLGNVEAKLRRMKDNKMIELTQSDTDSSISFFDRTSPPSEFELTVRATKDPSNYILDAEPKPLDDPEG